MICKLHPLSCATLNSYKFLWPQTCLLCIWQHILQLGCWLMALNLHSLGLWEYNKTWNGFQTEFFRKHSDWPRMWQKPSCSKWLIELFALLLDALFEKWHWAYFSSLYCGTYSSKKINSVSMEKSQRWRTFCTVVSRLLPFDFHLLFIFVFFFSFLKWEVDVEKVSLWITAQYGPRNLLLCK